MRGRDLTRYPRLARSCLAGSSVGLPNPSTFLLRDRFREQGSEAGVDVQLETDVPAAGGAHAHHVVVSGAPVERREEDGADRAGGPGWERQRRQGMNEQTRWKGDLMHGDAEGPRETGVESFLQRPIIMRLAILIDRGEWR